MGFQRGVSTLLMLEDVVALNSNTGVFIFQVGKSQVEGEINSIIRRAVWVVCILEQIECVGDAGFNGVHD